MYLDRLSAAGPDSLPLARDGQAAAQWEAAVAMRPGRTAPRVWPTGRLTSVGHWLAERVAAGLAGEAGRILLSRRQTERLWQRVIDESAAGRALISTAGAARWAREARGSLCDHGLDPGALGTLAWHGDSGAFLDWHRRFERRLQTEGWVDPESLLYRLNRAEPTRSPGPLVLLDPPPPSPEQLGFLARWRDGGGELMTLRPDDHTARRRCLIVTEPVAELEQIAAWAGKSLSAAPDARLAVVVGDLASRVDEVEAVLADRIGRGRISHSHGPSICAIGVFGAAVTALRLLAPAADFAVLSRWLRSPFFAAGDRDDAAARARLERSLRRDPRALQDFVAAYRRHGLRERMVEALPDAVAALDRVLEQLPRRASPTAWVECWQAALRQLGWQGFDTSLPDAQQAAWDRSWVAFAELTAITGPLEPAAAIAEFERIATATAVHEPPRLTGVHLFDRIADVGPGFGGVWVTGFSDAAWPEAPVPNPLLPFALRAQHNMPGTRPEQCLEAATNELERLYARVPEAIFSCPARILDRPQIPNPVFADWMRVGPTGRTIPRRGAARIGARASETRPDPAPEFVGDRIPGGPRTLDLQSTCPVRAFCDARLRTEALEPPVRGIDPRLRGVLLHRVVELLWAPGDATANATANATLDATADAPGDASAASPGPHARLEAVLARAFAELVPPGDATWQSQVHAERLRIATVLEDFVALEATREPFNTLTVEQKVDLELGGFRLRCRIDRIDRVAGGEALIIDYKTGQRAITGWFRERLGDCQLPLYAQHREFAVGGIAVVMLGADKVAYRAAGLSACALPGRQRDFAADEWQAQRLRWRAQLETLVTEFARGDVRIDLDDSAAADGAYAALTRLREAAR